MSYNSEAVKGWRKRTKDRATAAMGGKCILCGYSRCVRSLTFHHLDPSQKDFQINCGHARAWSDVVIELRKCVLLCHNCHNEVHDGMSVVPEDAARFDETYATYESQGTGGRKKTGIVPHGTRNGYRYHKCRCESCRAANAAYTKRFRSRMVSSVGRASGG